MVLQKLDAINMYCDNKTKYNFKATHNKCHVVVLTGDLESCKKAFHAFIDSGMHLGFDLLEIIRCCDSEVIRQELCQ